MRYLQRFWSYFLLIALVLVSYLANLFLLREILFYDAKRTSLIRIQSFEERLKQLKLTLELYDSKKIPGEINRLKTHLNLQSTDPLEYLPVCQSRQSKEYELFSKGDGRILFNLSKNPGCLSFTNHMMDQILGLDQSHPNWLMGFLLENHTVRTTKEQRVQNHLKEFQSSKQHLEKFVALENESYLITGSSNLQSRALQFYVGTTRNNIYKSPVTSRLFALHIVLGLIFLSLHWFSRRFRRRIFSQIQSLFQSEKQAENESIEKSIQRLREIQNSTKTELAEFMEKNQSLEYVLNSIPAFL